MDDVAKQYLEEVFQRVGVELRQLHAAIDTVDHRVGQVASTQADILTIIDKRFDRVEERLGNVEERLETIEEQVTPLVNQVAGHEKRVAFLEGRVL